MYRLHSKLSSGGGSVGGGGGGGAGGSSLKNRCVDDNVEVVLFLDYLVRYLSFLDLAIMLYFFSSLSSQNSTGHTF